MEVPKVISGMSGSTKLYVVLGVVGLISIAVGISAYTGFFKKVGSIFDSEESDKAELAASNDRLKELAQEGEKASYTDSQFKSMAQTLVAALKGLGNDLPKVAETFDKLKNEIDVRKLNYHFGMVEGENMANWLKSDLVNSWSTWAVTLGDGTKLSTSKYTTVADMARDILSLKSIPFAI